MKNLVSKTAFVAAGISILAVLPCLAQKRLAPPRVLAATVIVSPDDAFVREWDTPKPPQITRLRAMDVDQKVTVGVLLSGLRAVKGQIRYRVAVQVLDPGGKKVFDAPDFATGAGKAPAGNSFLLVDPTFDFSPEVSDPRGIYRFRAIVTDLSAEPKTPKTAVGEWKVELKAP